MNCIIFIFDDIIIFAPILYIKIKKKSLFDTIFYFLTQVRSPSRICKGRDIAVILSEKEGVVNIFFI